MRYDFFYKTVSLFLVVIIMANPIRSMPQTEESAQQSIHSETKAIKSSAQPVCEPSVDTKPSVITKYSGIILATLFLEIFFLTANPETQESFLQQLHPVMLFKNLAKEYSTHFIATFAHEFGHAVMAKGLNNNSINIHLGSNSGEKNSHLLRIPHVSLDGLMPSEGYALYSTPYENRQEFSEKLINFANEYCKKNNISNRGLSQEEYGELLVKIIHSPEGRAFLKSVPINKKKQAAILLAGGASGILVNFILKMLINNDLFNQDEIKPSPIDDIMINQLFNMFIPFNISDKSHSDSSKLYTQCLDIDPAKLSTVSAIAPYLDVATELYLAHCSSSPNSQIHSALLIGLINYQLRGFLRFRV